jgi:transcription initiation factor TFIID subunit 12
MNNSGQGGQPGQPSNSQQQQMMQLQLQQAQAQAQAQGQQPKRQITMFRPEQMRALPEQFTAEEKAKWEQGLRQLWGQIDKNPADSQPHQEAKRKLFEFSKTLTAKLAAAQRTAQQAGSARPPSQGQPQQAQGGEGSGGSQNATQQPRPQPKISPKLMEHVSNFPYVLPPQLTAGTPDAAKWLQDAKSRYLKALVAMEQSAARVQAMDNHIQKRKDDGNPLSPEEEKDLKEKKEQSQKGHAEAKAFVDSFRAQQAAQRNAQNAANQQGNAAQQSAANAAGNAGQAAPTRPQMNPQQVPNPAIQNTQTVNAAIEAARNQQMNGGRPQGPQGMANQAAPSLQKLPQQAQNIKTEAGVPPQINTAVSQMQQANQARSMNSPQSAVPQSAVPRSAGPPQSATSQAPQQIPTALSHSDALHQAARSYSTGQPSSANVMGHSHPSVSQPRESQNIITNKMPIPKHLPERAAAPPQPAAMPQARPTLSGGPSNSGNGVLAQPVLPRTPQINMDPDGDRVLSKKKLDELVRQVTGGGQGEGECLAPDVESVCLPFPPFPLSPIFIPFFDLPLLEPTCPIYSET